MFDIDIPGGIRFMESDVLSAGDSLTVIGRLNLSLRVHTMLVESSSANHHLPAWHVTPPTLTLRCWVADTVYGKIGLGICYDMRFAHMTLLYAQQGCRMVVFPGAFNTTTGPAHWELLLRSRALDSQVRACDGCARVTGARV